MEASSGPASSYDQYYYNHCCGSPYQCPENRKFFDYLGHKIATEIGPGSVMDAGCAMGYLVSALRKRGVAACGFDISDYAVHSAEADVRPYCRVGSILEPWPGKYDLVVCMEVLEHLPPAEAEQAVQNICRSTDDVLFSSTPLDYKEPSHVNVRPTAYWASLFAQNGFYRDVEFDATFITPWAMRFRRSREPVPRMVAAYERRIWDLVNERQTQRVLAMEQHQELVRLEQRVNELNGPGEPLPARVARQDQAVAALQAQLAEHQNRLHAITGSMSWRICQRLQRLRQAVAPQGSARYRLLRSLLRGLKGLVKGKPQPTPAAAVPPAPAPGVVDPAYMAWRQKRLADRAALYRVAPRAGLFSLLTSAWNTPVVYLEALARSVLNQDYPDFEWVILDNGSSDRDTRAYLADLARHPRVKYYRVEDNRGILGGMRFCLKHATGEYVLPLDSDDYLTEDCLRIMAWHVEKHGRPALLYSDEDILQEEQFHSPNLKPRWDPVLVFNHCYVAHLDAINRELALKLGAYTDPGAEGCHDWDTFLRFYLAGHTPVHVPEVLYGWRTHPGSCALINLDSKTRIYSSHKHVLGKFLAAHPHAGRYRMALNPLCKGNSEWWFRRAHADPRPLLTVVLCRDPAAADLGRVTTVADYPGHRVAAASVKAGLNDLRRLAEEEARRGGLVQLVSEQVRLSEDEWPWEVLALMELYPDTVMVGGRVLDPAHRIVAAGEFFGYGGVSGCPEYQLHVDDPGFLGTIWKQRSVSAVSSLLSVVDASFLADFFQKGGHPAMSPAFLGAWLGAYAARIRGRVVFTPHVTGYCWTDPCWRDQVSQAEVAAFASVNADLIPERRYWPRHLSLNPARRFQYVTLAEQRAYLAAVLPQSAGNLREDGAASPDCPPGPSARAA